MPTKELTMANINSILQARTKQTQNSSKMKAMAQQSANGNLTSFAGIFSVVELSEREREKIAEILSNYRLENQQTEQDLEMLLSLTSEVKAINNQAAILHGERIKKAHQILINYREGAFTAWLITTYGNRQTPYNLMQYYEFYEAMPKYLRTKIELIPRQAVYTLATRQGDLKIKQEIVENYQGQTKKEMLEIIRQRFPLEIADKRRPRLSGHTVQNLEQICKRLEENPTVFSVKEKQQIKKYLEKLQLLIGT